jgi:hypothetical protein
MTRSSGAFWEAVSTHTRAMRDGLGFLLVCFLFSPRTFQVTPPPERPGDEVWSVKG